MGGLPEPHLPRFRSSLAVLEVADPSVYDLLLLHRVVLLSDGVFLASAPERLGGFKVAPAP